MRDTSAHAVPGQIGLERQRLVMHDLRKRMIDHVAAQSTDRTNGYMELDPGVYTDPERLKAEKAHIFHRLPIVAGLTQDIPNPGDILVFDALGPSIVITRNREGQIGAFLNACRHRAAKVMTEPCGHGARMTCRFHGWTYDLDGKLVGLPDNPSFPGLDREAHGLVRLPSKEWNGLIFIKATPGDEEIDIDSYLGSFAPEMAQLDLASARPVAKGRLDVDANWKYALDTYGEGYHFATLHPTSIGTRTINNTMVYSNFGAHHRCNFPVREFADFAQMPEQEWPELAYRGIHLLFPNTVVNVSPMPNGKDQFYIIFQMIPGETPDKAFTLITTYRPGHCNGPNDDSEWQAAHDFIFNVVRTEDYSVSKDGQANLETAPEGFKIVFGANELALQNHHRHIADLIGMPLSGAEAV